MYVEIHGEAICRVENYRHALDLKFHLNCQALHFRLNSFNVLLVELTISETYR